ncbi:MAG: hypothetical protein ACE5EU_03670 [Paracoccaceae bacterium]
MAVGDITAKTAGFMGQILVGGFSGTADTTSADACPKLIEYKSNVGRHLHDMPVRFAQTARRAISFAVVASGKRFSNGHMIR